MNAELDLGQSYARGSIVKCHSIITGERELGATAHTKTLDHRHCRAAQCRDSTKQRLTTFNHDQRFLGGLDLQKFIDVGAGNKTTGFSGTKNDSANKRSLTNGVDQEFKTTTWKGTLDANGTELRLEIAITETVELPDGAVLVFIRDPDGNVIELHKPA